MKKFHSFFLLFALSMAFVISCQPKDEAQKAENSAVTSDYEGRRQVGQLVIEDIPEIPQEISDKYLQYSNIRGASFSGWNIFGDGIFINTRFAETSQVHLVDMAGGARKQLTFYSEPVGGVSVCPDKSKEMFLLTKDIGGNEAYQIYKYDIKDGSTQLLTDGKSRHGGAAWSHKGDKFVYTSNKRNGKDMDIYVASIDNPADAKLIFESDGHWGPIDWSMDDSKLLVYNYKSITNNSVQILDINTKELTPLATSEEEFAMGAGVATFARNGKGIYYLSDLGNEFLKLYFYDFDTKESTPVAHEIEWDIENMVPSPDGKLLALSVNEDGMSKFYMLDTKTNKLFVPKSIPTGTVSGYEFSGDSKKLAMTISTKDSPGDVYVLDLAADKTTRWTFSEIGGLNTDEFVEPQLIHYPTFDEVDGTPRMIPAYYYKPKGEGPFPVVVSFHGGPESQFRPGFASTYQFWLNELGIAVIAPNVRGSAGYGKTYLKLDNGFDRENSVKDGGALLDWIATQPELNSEKVCVFGGSYGGYMSLAMMTNYNDRLAAGVDIVGISNFVTFLKNTKDYRRDLRRAEYGDERDEKMREFQEKIAPLNNSQNITKPMFIIQGYNDPRVPASEAEQMVTKIRENKGDVWYLLAMDEGHGFRKKGNRDYYSQSVALFLKTMLKDK